MNWLSTERELGFHLQDITSQRHSKAKAFISFHCFPRQAIEAFHQNRGIRFSGANLLGSSSPSKPAAKSDHSVMQVARLSRFFKIAKEHLLFTDAARTVSDVEMCQNCERRQLEGISKFLPGMDRASATPVPESTMDRTVSEHSSKRSVRSVLVLMKL